MPKVTIVVALVLIALGLFGYFGADSASPSKTALIPAFFGGGLLVCGVLAFQPTWRKHAMHVAALLGTVGFLAAGGRGVTKLGTVVSDVPFDEKRPAVLVLLMALVCLIFVVLCVRSFISARKARTANPQG